MDSDLRDLIARREILSAYVTVLEHPEELLRICAGVSDDGATATSTIAAAFHISDVAADAILSLQVIRFTPSWIERTRTELADINRQILAAGLDSI